MKKLAAIIFSVLFLGCYISYARVSARFDQRVLGAEVLSQEDIDALCEGKEWFFIEPEIFLNEGRIPYDKENNMLLVPQSLAEGEFLGTLSIGPESDKGGVLYFLEDEEGFQNKEVSISQNRVFRLWLIGDAQYWMYNVYFTGMPVAFITSSGEVNEEGDDLGNIEVFDQYHSAMEYQSADCKWHVRGATTLNYEKKCYRLSLTDDKLSFLGMRKDDDWILHALYDDDGLIHNKLSYEVWQRIARDNHVNYDEGIQMEYVELFMDNTYLGVYGLSERIDQKALSMTSRGILYKCVDIKDPGVDDFYSELTEGMAPTFEMKYPREFDMEDWDPLRQWTNLFLFDGLSDYEQGTEIINMENAIDYNLFTLLTCGMDNIRKNIYFHAVYQGNGSYQIIKIPWDLNMTWGNSWIDDYNRNFNCFQEKNFDAPKGWTPDVKALYQLNPEEMGKQLSERWWELREYIITKETLCDIADAQYSYLHGSGAYTRNYIWWPPKGEYWQDDYIYEYIDKRLDFLDNYIGQLGNGA